MEDVIEKAFNFAKKAHGDQKRKYTLDPYVNHLIEVRDLVSTVKHDESMLAAALLHDTIEDTHITYNDVEKEFGQEIAKLVYELTDISKPEDGNRATRKSIDRNKLSKVSTSAQTIKLADIYANIKSIEKNDKKFAKVFLDENRQLLNVLTRGDRSLHVKSQKIVDEYFSRQND